MIVLVAMMVVKVMKVIAKMEVFDSRPLTPCLLFLFSFVRANETYLVQTLTFT